MTHRSSAADRSLQKKQYLYLSFVEVGRLHLLWNAFERTAISNKYKSAFCRFYEISLAWTFSASTKAHALITRHSWILWSRREQIWTTRTAPIASRLSVIVTKYGSLDAFAVTELIRNGWISSQSDDDSFEKIVKILHKNDPKVSESAFRCLRQLLALGLNLGLSGREPEDRSRVQLLVSCRFNSTNRTRCQLFEAELLKSTLTKKAVSHSDPSIIQIRPLRTNALPSASSLRVRVESQRDARENLNYQLILKIREI